MPEPLTLRRSKAVGQIPLAQHGEHLRGERLVELDQVHVGQRQPGPLHHLGRRRAPGRCPSSAAARRPPPSRPAGPADAGPAPPPSPAWSPCRPRRRRSGRSRCRPSPSPRDRLRPITGRSCASALERGVGAGVLVAVDHRDAVLAVAGPRPARSPRRTARSPGRRRRAGGSATRARPAPRAGSRTRGGTFSAVSIIPPGTGWFTPPAVTRPRTRRSCSIAPPARAPQRSSVEYSSVWLMLSAPPATIRSATPVCTCIAASTTACSPEPQRRSTCSPGTSTGRPASSAATRPSAGASPLA